jgi:hypothetical protein
MGLNLTMLQTVGLPVSFAAEPERRIAVSRKEEVWVAC